MLRTDLSTCAAEQFHCLLVVYPHADVLQHLQKVQEESPPLILRQCLKPRPTRGRGDEHRGACFHQSNTLLHVLTASRSKFDQAAKAVRSVAGTKHLFCCGGLPLTGSSPVTTEWVGSPAVCESMFGRCLPVGVVCPPRRCVQVGPALPPHYWSRSSDRRPKLPC